jgi:hypothetical protein
VEQFEKVIKIDPSRDEGQGYEKVVCIEKLDHEYYQAYEPHVIEEIRKELGIKNEKIKSKTPPGKPKKVDTKLHEPTVANLQEKLQ